MNFHINKFCKRQTPLSRFSHFSGTDEELLSLIKANCTKRHVPKNGTGIIKLKLPTIFDPRTLEEILAPNPDAAFYTSIVQLKDGDVLTGKFEPRQNTDEDPRKHVWVQSSITSNNKVVAKSVELILYSSALLAQSNDNDLEPVDGNWELISINASPTKNATPIHPITLMYNYFGMSGGTWESLEDLGDDQNKFLFELETAFRFWHDKATRG